MLDQIINEPATIDDDIRCIAPNNPVGSVAPRFIVGELAEHVSIPRPSPIYRPETADEQAAYIVHLPAFVGPLDLLLYLIEKRQMEITTISLVAVTDQYLAYLHSRDKSVSHDKSGSYGQDPAAGVLPLANMAAFISIAARLLFIKSQSLLPITSKEESGSEGEHAIAMADELRRHLLEYKAAKEIARLLRQREEAGLQTYERSGLFASIEAQLAWTPPALVGVEPQVLAQTFQHLLQRPAKEEQNGATLLPLARVSVRDRIAEILASLNKQPRISLAELTENEPSHLVIIVTFLAILDMWKQERITVQQDTPFGPIYLERGTRWAETETG